VGGFCAELNITKEARLEAFSKMKVFRPIDKLNLWAMPVQDAIDMAVFLATVQVEMDRFLPGTPACGGPIDVMGLRAIKPGDMKTSNCIQEHARRPARVLVVVQDPLADGRAVDLKPPVKPLNGGGPGRVRVAPGEAEVRGHGLDE
jgi:hypothetical protein